MRHFRLHNQGFTLVEIMVSVAIFALIMVMGMSSLVSMTNSYRIAQQEKQVHDSLNYVLEMMTRDIRLGRNYHVNPLLNGGDQGTTLDGRSSSFGFDAADGRGYIIFFVGEDGILYRQKFTSSGVTREPLTNPDEIIIHFLSFYVEGTNSYVSGDYEQPKVWIQFASSGPENRDRITAVQTFVSQRVLDF